MMYSDKKNILQLAALLKAHGITDAVLCPGSRNAPIVHTLSTHPGFTCYAMTDERSAGYFAIGLALESGRAAAVCCTSGTALLNLHPAVAEAYYQHVPLVVISADRPAAWIGQMDGQTLPQPGVFRTLVARAVTLPEIRTEEDEWYCNRLLNETLLAAGRHGGRPVHINVPISEPLFRFTAEALPRVRVMTRCPGGDVEWGKRLDGYRKRMVVAGQTNRDCPFEGEDAVTLCRSFVWIAEHLANRAVPGSPIRNSDTVLYTLSDEEADEMAPELLITYGGHIVSKRLKNFLRRHPPKEHWHVTPDGEIADLYGSLTTVIETDPFDFLHGIARSGNPAVSAGYLRLWENRCKAVTVPDFAYSEMAAVGLLIKSLPESCVLHLANSSVVRYAQLYPVPPGVKVCCNRGTSGIEGSLSTAVGHAVRSEKLNFVAIGDLSFFYDMNALWNANIRPNLRILLLNNGGGEIFHSLPGLDLSGGSCRYITAGHRTSARGWAEERGFRYLRVGDEKRLQEAMAVFTRPGATESPMLMEVFTDKDNDVRLLEEYYHQLKQNR